MIVILTHVLMVANVSMMLMISVASVSKVLLENGANIQLTIASLIHAKMEELAKVSLFVLKKLHPNFAKSSKVI